MPWYFDPAGTTMDVYDHDGTRVATDYEFGGSWSGDFPDAVLDVMHDNMEASNQPTAYNQQLLADAAFENIEEGTPPS